MAILTEGTIVPDSVSVSSVIIMEITSVQINTLFFKMQRMLTALVGALASSRIGFIKSWMIRWVIAHFKIDMTEALQPDLTSYACFNDFFIRKLQPSARPIDNGLDSLVSPADGFISQFGQLRGESMIQAKGSDYSVSKLLGGSAELCSHFENGHYACIYLSPKDYHRVHMPVAGRLREMTYIPGSLYPVRPKTVNQVADLFAKNERLVCVFDTQQGPMVQVLVGALIVASIHTVWHGPVRVSPLAVTGFDYSSQEIIFAKGDEMGHFQMGSTVIVLFNNELSINWGQSLQPGGAIKMGQAMGHWTHESFAKE